MVAVEGKAPWGGFRGLPEENKVVRVLVAYARGFDQITQKTIDAHCAEGFCVAFRRQSGGQDGEDGVADWDRQFV